MGADTAREVAAAKADLTTSYMDTYGGLLQPEQLDTFFDWVQHGTQFLDDVIVERLDRQKKWLEFTGFTSRVLYPVSEGSVLADEQKSRVTMGKVVLDTVECHAKTYVSDRVLKSNIERIKFRERVMRELSGQASRDIQYYAINSDSDSVDDYLSQWDGLLVQCESNVVDNSSDPQDITDDVFMALMLELDSKYWEDKEDLRFYVSPRTRALYANYIRSNRATTLGDLYYGQDSKLNMKIDGIQIFDVPNMPTDKMMLTNRNNIVVGIWEEVKTEVERVAPIGNNIHLVVYVDWKLKIEDGAALYKGLKSTLQSS